jgi:hypothetical protein
VEAHLDTTRNINLIPTYLEYLLRYYLYRTAAATMHVEISNYVLLFSLFGCTNIHIITSELLLVNFCIDCEFLMYFEKEENLYLCYKELVR